MREEILIKTFPPISDFPEIRVRRKGKRVLHIEISHDKNQYIPSKWSILTEHASQMYHNNVHNLITSLSFQWRIVLPEFNPEICKYERVVEFLVYTNFS